MLKIDLKFEKGILFVRLNGSLSRRNSRKINNYIFPLIRKYNIKLLVFNLQSLKNIDLKGRDILLNSKYVMKKNKGKIFLCQVNKKLEDFLKGIRIPRIKNEREAKALLKV